MSMSVAKSMVTEENDAGNSTRR
uniref:Uncharacterized protein n=1 Tax=Arundo donax TaxID=35708 RepID=A0A0A9G1Z5_ARUDO